MPASRKLCRYASDNQTTVSKSFANSPQENICSMHFSIINLTGDAQVRITFKASGLKAISRLISSIAAILSAV